MLLPKVDAFTLFYHGLVETIAELLFGYSDVLPTENKNILLSQADEFIRNTPGMMIGVERLFLELSR